MKLFLTNPKSAMRDPEQVALEEWHEAQAVFAHLRWHQRMEACIRARVPMLAAQESGEWASWWRELKGGLVWMGYDLTGLIRAATGVTA